MSWRRLDFKSTAYKRLGTTFYSTEHIQNCEIRFQAWMFHLLPTISLYLGACGSVMRSHFPINATFVNRLMRSFVNQQRVFHHALPKNITLMPVWYSKWRLRLKGLDRMWLVVAYAGSRTPCTCKGMESVWLALLKAQDPNGFCMRSVKLVHSPRLGININDTRRVSSETLSGLVVSCEHNGEIQEVDLRSTNELQAIHSVVLEFTLAFRSRSGILNMAPIPISGLSSETGPAPSKSVKPNVCILA